MNRIVKIAVVLTAFALFTVFSMSTTGQTNLGNGVTVLEGKKNKDEDESSRIQKGLAIAPVTLNLKGKNRSLVGLGSYIVNAQAACSECHTCPSFAFGHNPFAGGDGQINSANYLAGGVPFGSITSANITPDASGKPAGLEFEEYLHLIRTGHDPDEPDEILQVMPWPFLRNMNDHDILAIYTYLTAIPHAEPGSCTGPEQ